jgi:hypothetical protein
MKTYALKFLIVLLAVCSVSALTLQNSSDKNWQTIAVNDLFSFRVPPGFIKCSSNGTEDERAEYYRGETRLVYVWGHTESVAYSDRRKPSMNDYEESTTRIGGKRANIRTYRRTVKGERMYRAELNVGNWEKGEVQLYMRIESSDPAVLDTAREIFKSVTFPLPPPERQPKGGLPQRRKGATENTKNGSGSLRFRLRLCAFAGDLSWPSLTLRIPHSLTESRSH